MARCCAGFAAMLRDTNRDDRSGDLFGNLKADVRVTRQPRKRRPADALRILFVTGMGSLPEGYLLVEHKNGGPPPRGTCLRVETRRHVASRESGNALPHSKRRRWPIERRCCNLRCRTVFPLERPFATCAAPFIVTRLSA